MGEQFLSYPFIFQALIDGNYICKRQKVLKNGLIDYVVIAPDEVTVLGQVTAEQFDELLKSEIISWVQTVQDYVKTEIRQCYELKEKQTSRNLKLKFLRKQQELRRLRRAGEITKDEYWNLLDEAKKEVLI